VGEKGSRHKAELIFLIDTEIPKMKKSFIAIAIAAITSTSTFASTVNHHDAIAVDSSSFHVEKSADGNDYLFVDGKPIGKIEEYNEEQGKAVLSPMRGPGEIMLSTHKHGHIDYVSFDGDGNEDRGSLIVTEKIRLWTRPVKSWTRLMKAKRSQRELKTVNLLLSFAMVKVM
jgi:hypothetical protein